MNILDRLEKLERSATPGPWFRLHDTPPTVQADDLGEEQPDGSRPILAQPKVRECNCAQVWSLAADCPVSYCAVGPDDAPTKEGQMANAALIGAARTHLPALLRLARVALKMKQEHDQYSDTNLATVCDLDAALAPLLEETPNG